MMKHAIAFVVALTTAVFAGGQQSQPTIGPVTPEAILAEIDALHHPDFDRARADDEKYAKDFDEVSKRLWARQAELELEFYQRFPDHPKAEGMLIRRWGNQLSTQADIPSVTAEVDEYLKAHAQGPRSDDDQLALTRVQWRLANGKADRVLQIAETFAKANPHNEAAADMFLDAAEKLKGAEQEKLFRRIINEYPNSSSAILAGGKLRQTSQIGLPFALGFFDVRTGQWVHTRWLRGKVVIVQFWATWCGPCVGEIPELKDLYEKYRGRGLEILGVSLDGPHHETDLEKVKKFVKEHAVEWPQYYQGEGFDSGFSRSWGINAIPAVFVIDREGKLRSTDARDKLNRLIPKLIADHNPSPPAKKD